MSHNSKSGSHGRRASGVGQGNSDLVFHGDHYTGVDQIKNQTEPGEILEFQRGSYTHFGLYLGDGRIMCIEIVDYNEAVIQERTLEEVCQENPVRVVNHEFVAQAEFQLNPKPANEIIQEAMSYRNQVVPYEFDFRNCEYYCTLWRYGKGFSAETAKQPKVPTKSAVHGHSSGNHASGGGPHDVEMGYPDQH